MTKLLAFAVRAMAGTLACVPCAAQAGTGTKAGERGRAIGEFVADCARFGFSGSVLVAEGDEIVFERGFGLAEREPARANDPDTLFEIASATKPFTAVAVLQLVAAGKLRLDDSIAEHLPGVPAEKRGITVLHLLSHTSGMPRSAAGGSGEDLEAAVRAYLAPPFARQPGKEHEYWNGGYALLAGIVERASGQTYMRWCAEHIFQPAGMQRSGFTGGEFADGNVATGYEGSQAPRKATEHPYHSYGWQYRGMGGLVTSARDFLRFARALRDDRLLPKALREKLFEEVRASYALGFYRQESPRLRLSHGGDVRGFHMQFSLYPAANAREDVFIVVLCNVGGIPTWTIAENLQHLWFGDDTRYPLPPHPGRAFTGPLAELAGSYQASEEERIQVVAVDSALELRASGVQTTVLLTHSVFGPAKAAPQKSIVQGQRILEALARSDLGPLRRDLAEGIPKRWPDDVIRRYWPERIAVNGPIRRMRVVGALESHDSTTLLYELEQERGRSHVKIEFQGGKLRILDLAGPEHLGVQRAVPTASDRWERFSWEGTQPAPIEVLRSGGGAPTGIKLGGAVYRRDKR